jgi:hypothetical protein
MKKVWGNPRRSQSKYLPELPLCAGACKQMECFFYNLAASLPSFGQFSSHLFNFGESERIKKNTISRKKIILKGNQKKKKKILRRRIHVQLIKKEK